MTGDFASLSLTDIKVLALTLQLEWEANGREHLRDEPVKLQTKAGNTTVQPIPIKESNVENEEPSTKKKRVRPKKKEKKNADVEMSQEPELSAEPAETQKDEIVESDSDGEWITPQNISEHKKKDSNLGLAEIQPQKSISVGCITDDFAMQNVLLQMKLNLLSIDGMLIKKLKNWVLRCHACFKITTQMDKVFCPTCGNNTLIRTSIAIDQNGKMTIYLKKNFQYNNRGTVYSIPAPKGGRNSKDLILREDQNEHLKALAAKKRLDKKALNQDVTMDELLAFGQPGARLSATGNPVIGYGRKNPNDVRNRKKK
ncbi:Nin1 binding protein [Boothiomyces macroporosus]|uniref:Nin1 binding protein n=1 Tax=Boothiomyces macroporosus TaxID=261099 RepID=A0AAD5U8K2_9FUNG|nr:Nin1 binding protein [Boothiomyces macroporosus]